jgi:hypothetical protein
MNTGLDIERVLDIWFEDGPGTVAGRVVDDALAIVERTDQQRGWRSVLGAPVRPLGHRWATVGILMAALAVGLALVVGLLAGRGLFVAPTTPPIASPTPLATRPAAVVSPSPVLRASKPPRPSGADLLLMGNPMASGRTYTTLSFEPAFTVEGADGWLIPLPAPGAGRMEGPAHAYFFVAQPVFGKPIPSVGLIRPSQVITEGGVSTNPAPTTSADMVAWLLARRDLALSKPFRVQIGDLTGTALDGTIRKGASTNSVGAINMICSSDNTTCGWVNGEEIGVASGLRFRFVVLDVRGQTVLLLASGPASSWSTDLPLLERFMNSVTFPGPTG